LFEQLGEPRLEGAITTDICGKKDSHAIRLDKEAVESIQKVRLHRKAATTIFFESNGGQTRVEATVPEIRLAVAEPSLDIGNEPPLTPRPSETPGALRWTGEIPAQKWMNFYTKVLSKFRRLAGTEVDFEY
jgi:hypothetical protein